MTIRLKCLGLIIEKAIEGDKYCYIHIHIFLNLILAISNLSNRENWILDDNSKTSLPDLYVTEVF